MSKILFACCTEELPLVINAANELLEYKRLHGSDAAEEEILGIVIRSDLHKGVPTWTSFDPEQGTGVFTDDLEAPGIRPHRTGKPDLALRSTYVSRGAWAVCTFDGPALRNTPGSDARREKIVSVLKGVFKESRWLFLPVFSREKDMVVPGDSPGSSWHFYDREQGIVQNRASAAVSAEPIPA